MNSDTIKVAPPELWGIDDIASFFRRSRRTAQRIVKRPGFPAPTPTDPGRWVAQRVVDHVLSTPEPAHPDVLPASHQRIERVVRRKTAA